MSAKKMRLNPLAQRKLEQGRELSEFLRPGVRVQVLGANDRVITTIVEADPEPGPGGFWYVRLSGIAGLTDVTQVRRV